MGIYVGSEAVKVYGAGVYRGDDGGYYTPSVSQSSSTSFEIAYTPSSTDMPSVPKTVVTLPKGDPGSPGAKGDPGAGVQSMVYNSTSNTWSVTLTDGSTMTVDGPAIPDVSGYMPKSGGTFSGAVKAASAATGSYYVRNIKFSTEAETPTTEGDICFKLA